jgi:hypothetical protein
MPRQAGKILVRIMSCNTPSIREVIAAGTAADQAAARMVEPESASGMPGSGQGRTTGRTRDG